jgi:hypothetical protein
MASSKGRTATRGARVAASVAIGTAICACIPVTGPTGALLLIVMPGLVAAIGKVLRDNTTFGKYLPF